MSRRKPLSALSMVFAGFVLLVLVSQISWHFLAQAVLTYIPDAGASLTGMQNASVELAYSAGALGLTFSGAVLFITKEKLDSELRVYKVTGLPVGSALGLMLRSHPLTPVVWALVVGAASGAVDLALGLDAGLPVGLAVLFCVFLLAWIVLITARRFSDRGMDAGRRGRTG